MQNIFSNANLLGLFDQSLDEVLADLSRLSRDIELQSSDKVGGQVTMVLPNPQPILNKIETLEKQFYQFKCFEKASNGTEFQERLKEILKTNLNHILSLDSVGDGGSSLAGIFNMQFKDYMQQRLISKDYVIRMGGQNTNTESLSAEETAKNNANLAVPAPQFLRAIVTGKKLRLCGAFTENTTFVD